MSEDIRWMPVTKVDAEIILDSLKVSNPLSRPLALKAASIVLEFAAAEEVQQARMLVTAPAPRTPAE